MKKAQTIIEYVFLSILTIFLAAVVIGAFNLTNISANATFGVKLKNHVMAVPPMTP